VKTHKMQQDKAFYAFAVKAYPELRLNKHFEKILRLKMAIIADSL